MRRFRVLATGLFTLVGCGDDGIHHLADAPPAGSADAPPPDSPPAPVVTTVTTLARNTGDVMSNSDAPIAGVTVQVINPDLTLGPSGTTDVHGKVTFTSPTFKTGSIVTAIYPEDIENDNRIVSFVNVGAGANITFGDHYFTPAYADSPSTVLTVSWPAITSPGFSNVSIFTPCNGGSGDGSSNTTGTISVSNDCAGSAIPMQFLASDGSGNNVDTGWISAAPVGSGSGSGSGITLDAWHPLPGTPNFTMTATGFPATSVIDDAREVTPYMPVARTGRDHNYSAGNGMELDGSGNGSASVITALDGARTTGELDIFSEADTGSGGGWEDQVIYKVAAANASTIAFTPTGLPFIGRTLAVSPTDGTVTWVESAGATTHGDVAIANLGWSTTVGETTHFYNWTIIAPPPTTSQLSWAGFPAAVAAYVPPTTADVFGTVRLLDIAAVTSYEQAIALPEWQLTDSFAAMLDGDVISANTADGGEGNGGDKRKHGTGATRATARAKAFAIAHPSHRAR